MALLSERFRPPSIKELSFNCPHCGALAKQFWHHVLAEKLSDDRLPLFLTSAEAEGYGTDVKDENEREKIEAWARRVAIGLPFMDDNRRDPYALPVRNISISHCHNCRDIGIWIGDRLVWPNAGDVPMPNPDLSADVKRDYEEAAAILDASPRGAAALLRLAIQKMCIALGGTGKNLNEDIARLVASGLDSRVQQALDVVRVVGNNAVHPGEMDLRDDRGSAERLFQLVNLIADIMISQPKHVASMFAQLPEKARQGIELRDQSKKNISRS